MRIHSHSSLGSFENCPRQYWYQYIGKPDVERVDTIEAFLGTCVHETLEELYRIGRPPNSRLFDRPAAARARVAKHGARTVPLLGAD